MAKTIDILTRLLLDKKGFESGLQGATDKIGRVAKIGAAAAVATGGLAAVKFTNFESSMAEVLTLIEATPQEADAMRDSVLGLTKEFGVSGGAVDVASGLYQTLSAGFSDATSSQDILRSSIKAGKAALTDTNTAVDAITTVLNAYGLKSSEAGRISDLMFETVKRGKTTFPEMAAAIGRVTAIAPAVGASFEDIAAATATLTSAGINTDQSMTAITAIMRSFLKPSADMKARLEELGFASGTAAIESLGLQGALEAVTDGADQESIGKLFQDTEALKGVLPLVGSQAETMAKNLDAMGKSAGATDGALAKVEDTAKDRLNKLKAGLDVALIEIGEPIVAAVEGIIAAFAEGFGGDGENAIDTIVEAIEDLTPALEGAARAAGRIFGFFDEHPVALEAVAGAIGAIVIVLVALKIGMFAAAVAGAAASAAFLPITLIVLGISAAIFGLIVVIKNWGAISDWIGDKWSATVDWVKQKATDVKEWVIAAFTHLMDGTLSLFSDIVDGVLGAVAIVVSGIVGLKDKVVEKAGDLLQAGVDFVMNILSGGKEAMVDLLAWYVSMPSRIVASLGSVTTLLKQAGLDIIQGLWNGMQEKWASFTDWLYKAWAKIEGILTIVTERGSPAKRFIKAGRDIVEGTRIGMEDLDDVLDLRPRLERIMPRRGFNNRFGGRESGITIQQQIIHLHGVDGDLRRQFLDFLQELKATSGGMRPG